MPNAAPRPGEAAASIQAFPAPGVRAFSSSRNSLYSTLSTSASHDASITFSLTPIVATAGQLLQAAERERERQRILRALASNEAYLQAVVPQLQQAKVSVLLIPGLGTMRELRSAYDCGARSVHVATHCTEADTSPQHIACARELGMDTTGFLMMAHLNTPEGLAQQAKLMESYGAQTVYVTDSAGYMLPDDVKARLSAVREALKPETELGFHGHHNMAMGIANSLAAVEAGASRIDAAAAGLGAGAGNTPMEVFIAVCDRMGIDTGVDVFKIQDVAEDLVVPIMDHVIRIDRDSLTLGYAGVYSSFLLFAKRAEKKYGISARELLVELGRKGMVGGQEDMIEDTAMTLAKARGLI